MTDLKTRQRLLGDLGHALYHDAHHRVAGVNGTAGDMFDALCIAVAWSASAAFDTHRDGVVTPADLEEMAVDFKLTVGKLLRQYHPALVSVELAAAIEELDAKVKIARGLERVQ